jgi:alpha-D-ribose 1-methylphosphonate 5-triphosphate synthase subunit PhnG
MQTTSAQSLEDISGRKRVVDLLARATREELEAAWQGFNQPAHERLRAPETGLVMVRGRIGGGGAAFNVGETTVTRASVRLETGRTGHGYRLGTDRRATELGALFDALWQDDAMRSLVEQSILAPIEQRLTTEKYKRAAETAATKVDFFTMVRGED